MLVLSRKLGEAIRIDQDITVQVLEVRKGRVRLGIQAPRSRRVVRLEVENPETMIPSDAEVPDRPKPKTNGLSRTTPDRSSNCCARP